MSDQTDTRAPEEKKCAYEYTVKRGDSFYLIAHRLGVPLRDLLDANSDINPARLTVGDVLCIPLEEDDRVQEETPVEQTPQTLEIPPVVIPDDETMDAPARSDASSAKEVQPEVITPAPMVTTPVSPVVPEAAVPEVAMPDAASGCNSVTLDSGETVTDVQLAHGLSWHTLTEANPDVDLENLAQGASLCVPEANTPCPLPLTYTLGAGETLENAALRYNVSISALLRANPCLAPDDFTEGAVIVLPQS